MNQRQLASVLFAAVGLFIAVSRLPELLILASMLATWDSSRLDPAAPASQRLIPIFGFIAALITIVLGSALVLFRERLAGRLFPSASGPLEAQNVQAVAFSVLGSYFVVRGLSGIVQYGFVQWSGLIQVVLGLGLFFGATGLAALWSRVRSGAASRFR